MQRFSLDDTKDIHKAKLCCLLCNRLFLSKKNLKSHMYTNTCQICNKHFQWTIWLDRHTKSHQCFDCEICNRRFSRRLNYVQHMKVHQKSYQCTQCPRIFRKEEDLLLHIDMTTCTMCKKHFAKIAWLQRHYKTHNTRFCYACPQCDRTFRRQKFLHKHEMIAHKKIDCGIDNSTQ